MKRRRFAASDEQTRSLCSLPLMCRLGGNSYSIPLKLFSLYGESDMRRKKAILVTAALLLVTSTSAQERRIKRSDLPAPVAQTAATESKGATVRGYAQETENGQTVYEVKLTFNGHTRDVQIDVSGNVLEVEEQVDIDKLPNEAKAALVAKAGAGTIAKVESLTKKQKLVAYEAQVNNNGKKSEIQVSPTGAPLDHEE
jgi:uncharacterized membrane protein YkoI